MFTAKSNSLAWLSIFQQLVLVNTEAKNIQVAEKRGVLTHTIRSGFTATHTAPYRKFGFTLAEVLITLGIIGVVAAMTLPALISNYKKAQTVSQLKASYSILSQAIKLSEVTNGEVKYWNYNLSSEQFFKKYLKEYLKKRLD